MKKYDLNWDHLNSIICLHHPRYDPGSSSLLCYRLKPMPIQYVDGDVSTYPMACQRMHDILVVRHVQTKHALIAQSSEFMTNQTEVDLFVLFSSVLPPLSIRLFVWLYDLPYEAGINASLACSLSFYLIWWLNIPIKNGLIGFRTFCAICNWHY